MVLIHRAIEEYSKTIPGLVASIKCVNDSIPAYLLMSLQGIAYEQAANPTGNSELDQREQQLTVREFGSERSRIYDSVTESEFKRNLGNRKASETQISAIRELYDTRLDKLLRADKKHTDAVDRFLAAKDKAGYAKHMQAAYKAKAPLAMDQAFKAIMPGKPGPAAKPADKPAIPGAKPADTTGWTRVAVKPAKDTIAHWKMSGKMLKEGKYILRDGKQVIYNGR